jgi:hypothetical protein
MVEIEKKHGLLKKAWNLLSEKTPNFTVWAKRNGFNHCGILSPLKLADDEFYLMTDSYGFNAKTIASAVVKKSFWSGKIAKIFDWQCFSSTFNETSQYEQLLGSDIRSDICSINFLPFLDKNEPHIFIAVETNDEEDTLTLPPAAECVSVLSSIINLKGFEEKAIEKLDSNIEMGLKISNSNLFILSLKNSISSAISGVNFDTENKGLRAAVSQSISEAAHVIIAPLFRKPNSSHVGTNGEIKIALFAEEEQDEQILGYHIARMLETLLGTDATKNVLLLTAGICPNKKGTLDFLLHG